MVEQGKNKSNKNGGLKQSRQKLKAKLLKSYYGNPTKDMKLIAITGTTGKTIVAHYVHEILKAVGEQVAVLASEQPFKMGMLHKFLSDAWKAGANYVVVTVPAEGLRDNIFYGLPVEVAAMTNFVTAGLHDMEPGEYIECEKTTKVTLRFVVRYPLNHKFLINAKTISNRCRTSHI
jgi:UDP-N-acetylmuramyl tripeptide synthase